MKTITLVAYNRLAYLEETINSLRSNNTAGYILYIGIEPGDRGVIDRCRSIDFIPTVITVNETRLGVAWNPHATMSRAFADGSKFNIAIEDDLLLSPDALDLANWFFDADTHQYFCLNLFNYHSTADFPQTLIEDRHFTPLGWAMRDDIWKRKVDPQWMCDRRGWDFSINAIIDRHPEFKLLRPTLARCNHNGREHGMHCSAEFHDKTFSHLPISDARSSQTHLRYTIAATHPST